MKDKFRVRFAFTGCEVQHSRIGIYWKSIGGYEYRNKKDAELISASWDMYEALKTFVEDWAELSGKVRGTTIDKIDAAIAKAEGKE